jgi:hypothetical protein
MKFQYVFKHVVNSVGANRIAHAYGEPSMKTTVCFLSIVSECLRFYPALDGGNQDRRRLKLCQLIYKKGDQRSIYRK